MSRNLNGFRKPTRFVIVNGRAMPAARATTKWIDKARKASIKEGATSGVGMI